MQLSSKAPMMAVLTAALLAGLTFGNTSRAATGAPDIDKELAALQEGVIIMAADLTIALKNRTETLAKHMRKTSHLQCLAKDANKICMTATRELVWSTLEADNASGYAGFQIDELKQMAQTTPFSTAQQELFTRLTSAYGILLGQLEAELTPQEDACVQRATRRAEASSRAPLTTADLLAIEILICANEAGVSKPSDFKKQAYEKQLNRVQSELQTSDKELKDFELAFPDLHQQVARKLKEFGY